jgi:hypothetical protein
VLAIGEPGKEEVVDLSRYPASLRAAVGGETKSYGFALVVWGTGALSEAHHEGLTQLDAAAFIGGVLSAMAVVILVTFGGPNEPQRAPTLNRNAVGAIHLLSVVGGLIAAWAITSTIDSAAWAYLVSGLVAILVYQLLLGLEIVASIRARPQLDER